MAELSARFKLIDEMSDKLGQMAEAGQQTAERWESAGEAASSAFEGVSGAVSFAVSSVDGIATSIDSYNSAVNDAAGTTDYWTDAVGDYSKSALEAMYSTEELVDMGYKSAEALEEERSVMELCEMASSDLSGALEQASDANTDLAEAISEASKMTEELAENDKVSEQAKQALQEATENASRAFEELESTQRAAQAAMDEYNAVTESGTASIGELEAAAERAGHAAENLAEANGKASEATEELSKATEKAAEEEENAEKSGIDMAEGVASALAAAGITAMVKEAAEAVYDLATAFSEAESTVVLATGATGDALDGLTSSMMDAYAASKTGSLDDTAAAVGEINTRLGYTGDTLTKTTGLFLDFAKATGGNAATSVRSVTQLMNQWNAPASEMESVLDKLTYAGQASGISVDTLTSQLTNNKAILDQLGFSLNEATALFMNMELEGTQTSAVMMGFRTALSNGAISSLEDLYDILEQAEQGLLSTEEAADIFGSRAGVAIVNAAQSGVFNLADFVGALENADGTLSTTAEAAQTLDEKWEQASNNISAAFTSAVEPTLSSLSSGFADIVNGFGTFLNEHPLVTKALTVIGVAIGAVAAAFAILSAAAAAHNAIMAISTAVNTAFGVSLSAAIWPITLVVAGIAAVVAIVATLVEVLGSANDETEGMTATTRAQYYELQDLNAEYEEACQKYGETSEEASRLKYQVDGLTASYEANAQTLEEFQAEVDELCSSVYELSDSWDEAQSTVNSTEVGTLALIQKYADLTSQSELTAAETQALEAVTNSLAESFPNLAERLDNAALSTEDYVEALRKACEQEAEEQLQQEAQDTYVEALKKRAALTEELEKAQANYDAELAAHNMYWDESMQAYYNGWYTADSLWASWTTDLDDYGGALDEVNAAIAENEAVIADIEQGWEDLADATEDAEEAIIDYEAAAETAYESIQEDVEALVVAYEEAYDAALESFQGQFGLFDKASMESDEYLQSTVEAAQKALDTQLSYWETYNANLDTLTEYGAGLSEEAKANYEALLEYASDGSEEAAGLAASMAEAIASGDEEAVAQLSETLAEVTAQQENAATTTAEWQTNFTEQMQGYADEMASIMTDDLNLSDEAAASAQATITSYANSILSQKATAVSAAQSVANAVSAAFSGTKVSVSTSTSSSTEADANGTTYSADTFIAGEHGRELVVPAHAAGSLGGEDYYIAGENGPELIVGEPGSTVFPTRETDRLISALNEKRRPLQIFSNSDQNTGRESATEPVKHILLEVAGNGVIEVRGDGADKETILSILTDNLKPILMNIIQGEIYEEGDYSYGY